MSQTERRESTLRALAEHPVFAALPAESRAELVDYAEVAYLEPGELLYEAGRPAHRVYALLEGALQIEYPLPGASRGAVTAILVAPHILGECQVLHARPWSGTGMALCPVTALGVREQELERLALTHAAFGLALYREVTLRFLNAIDAWKERPARTPAASLARYVVGCLEAVGQGAARRGELPMTQLELAQAAGLARETVNRVLSGWERKRLVTRGAQGLARVDLARLRKLAGKGSLVQRLDGRAVERGRTPPR
jgi:CRP-like cAMP-binding protein